MKKIILISLTSLFFFTLNAQQLVNGSLSGNCTGNGFNAPSCIKGWSSSHGSPTVLGNLNSNTWAWLSASKEDSNGIFTNYTFITGKTYVITFKIKSYTNIDNIEQVIQTPSVNVRAITGLTSSSAMKSPLITEESQFIWSKMVKKGNENWQTIKITYTATKDNSQLWFYPSVQFNTKLNEGSKVQMELDDIAINVTEENSISNVQNSITTDSSTKDYISPNPVYRGKVAKINSLSKNINEIILINLSGQSKKIDFLAIDENTVCFVLDDSIIEGIYTLKIAKKDGTIASKKLIVE